MTLIEPFDLETLFVTVFTGNWYIFMGLAVLVISALAARLRMNNYTFGIVLGLFAIFMFAWAPWFTVLVTVIGGLVIYYTVAKLGK